jgi:inner membrane protein
VQNEALFDHTAIIRNPRGRQSSPTIRGMDSLTHIVLGGCIGYGLYGRRLGVLGVVVTGIAATLPDMDVFFRTGDVVRDHLLHRGFMHSLVMAPVLAAVASFPFALAPRWNSLWKPLYISAVLACLAHPLLDGCTSYGTMMFWPFYDGRISWDLIAVVDLIFTLPLIVGLILSMRRRSATPARVAVVICVLYIAFGVMQHARAMSAQQALIAARGRPAEHGRVLPQIGAILNYRSIYIADQHIVADALRVPPIGPATARPGSAAEVVDVADLQPFPATAQMLADYGGYARFTDGYIARMPDHPQMLGDMRYTLTPEGFDPIWGLQLEGAGAPKWESFPRMRFVNKLLRDLVNPRGFVPLAAAAHR